MSLIPNLVTLALNEALLAPLSIDEVKAAVFQLGAIKSPSPDDYSSLFYQQNWDMAGLSLYRGFRSFYDNGYLLKDLNRTIIILILNSRNPTRIQQFCPISLYNFVYKVISKIVVNRLKLWIHSLIPDD